MVCLSFTVEVPNHPAAWLVLPHFYHHSAKTCKTRNNPTDGNAIQLNDFNDNPSRPATDEECCFWNCSIRADGRFDARESLPEQVAAWLRETASQLQDAAERIASIEDDRDLALMRRYLDLIKIMPLRSISSDRQLHEAQKMVDSLLARDLDFGEEQYLDALTDLIEKYESDACDFGDATCAQVLAFLIEDRGLAKKLGVFFGIAPSVFVDCE